MLKEIAEYIEDHTSLVVGTNLYTGHRPINSADTCVVLLETTGGNKDYYLTDKFDLPIQFISRSRNYFTAYSNAETIYDLLNGASGITLPTVTSGESYLVNTITSINSPTSIGVDNKDRYELSFNLMFHIQDSP